MSSPCNHNLCETAYCPHCGTKITRSLTRPTIKTILDQKVSTTSRICFFETPGKCEVLKIAANQIKIRNEGGNYCIDEDNFESLDRCGIKYATTKYGEHKHHEPTIDFWIRAFIKKGITNPSPNNVIYLAISHDGNQTYSITPHVREHKVEDPTRSITYMNNIDAPLYYSPKYDKLFEFNDLYAKLSFATQWFDFKDSDYKEMKILNVRIYILNSAIDWLLDISELRIQYAPFKSLTLKQGANRPTYDQLLFT